MNISPAGLNLLKTCEGYRSHTYLDVAGLSTIGYGHLLVGETFPYGITESHATALLSADLGWAEHAVTSLVTVPVTQGQFDALCDFTYNLGANALKTSTLLKLLNLGQYDAAGQELLKWNRAAGHVVAGLTTRRQAELGIWNG